MIEFPYIRRRMTPQLLMMALSCFVTIETSRRYRLKFAFTCYCTLDTTQLREIKKDGKVTMGRGGASLTVEVKDGKVIGIYKEDGEHVPVKEYRTEGTPSGLVEYIWNMGKHENDGQKLLSEPIGLLWWRGQEAIQSKPEMKLRKNS